MTERTITFLSMFLLFGVLSGVRAEERPIEKTLAEINERFENIEVQMVQWPDDVHAKLGELKKIAFMAYPEKKTEGKLPLLIALHGAGGKKISVQRQLQRSSEVKGLALAETTAKELILLEPNSAGDFDPKTLNTMLDYVLETYEQIDPDRVYVMGHSMGGSGTWKWINASPERFAAAAPCGFSSGNTGDVSRLTNLPIWGLVGAADGKNTASIELMVKRLKDAGNSQVKFTAFPGANHGRANAALFHHVELVNWMLGFSRQAQHAESRR